MLEFKINKQLYSLRVLDWDAFHLSANFLKDLAIIICHSVIVFWTLVPENQAQWSQGDARGGEESRQYKQYRQYKQQVIKTYCIQT